MKGRAQPCCAAEMSINDNHFLRSQGKLGAV